MNVNRKHPASERGQVLVLIVLGIVTMLGFTALAIDGATLYSDHRYTQNTADSTALAGGQAAARTLGTKLYSEPFCSNSEVISAMALAQTEAIIAARDNGFNNIDANVSNNRGVETLCDETNNVINVRVKLTEQSKTSFVQFVYGGTLEQQGETVVRIYPSYAVTTSTAPPTPATGMTGSAKGAVIALNPNACSGNSNGVQFRGDLAFYVTGTVFSNGCMDVDGGNHPLIKGGDVYYHYFGDNMSNIQFQDASGNAITGKSPVQTTNLIDKNAFNLADPCVGKPTFTQGDLEGKTNLTGLYCVTGDIKKAGFSGTNMTLVLMGGSLTLNSSSASIQSPPLTGYVGTAIPGVALYMPRKYYAPSDLDSQCGDVNQEIKINGGSGNGFRGVILAPCSDISIEGGSDTAVYQGGVIGWNVNSGGTADVRVNWDISAIPPVFTSSDSGTTTTTTYPPKIELSQ